MENNETINRLDSLFKQYDRQAFFFKYSYYTLQTIQLVLAASIPIVALVSPSKSSPILNSILGASILVAQGFQQSFQPNRKWVQYRMAARSLTGEKHLYLAKAGPYRSRPDASTLFAERIEAFVDIQNERWKELIESTFQAEGRHDRISAQPRQTRRKNIPEKDNL
jgi:hypothetical protein